MTIAWLGLCGLMFVLFMAHGWVRGMWPFELIDWVLGVVAAIAFSTFAVILIHLLVKL